MNAEIAALVLTAATVALLHTISGPDHYLPFIVLSKANGWSMSKTIGWTMLCGAGHVLSSVLLALGGAAIGWSVSGIGWLQHIRGGIAGWVMLLFGLLYLLWAIYQLKKNKPHKHFDMEQDGSLYVYEHQHGAAIVPGQRFRVTPRVLLLIFILGPCEPMVPLLFFPAAQANWWAMLLLITVYTACTLAAMLAMVWLGHKGISFASSQKLERYVHIIGGATVAICGIGMLWLGW
jgi:sulfite exporter TauE/SafE